MATIRLTRQSRSRGKKRRQIYAAEITYDQQDNLRSCDRCRATIKPWTNFRVTVIQNQQNYLYSYLDSILAADILRKIATFLQPKSHLCLNCVYHKIDQANRVLGLRQR